MPCELTRFGRLYNKYWLAEPGHEKYVDDISNGIGFHGCSNLMNID